MSAPGRFHGLPELSAELDETPLSAETAYRGLVFEIERLTVRLPDGATGQRDILRHHGGAFTAALDSEGRVYLVRQYRAALGRETLELPAGRLELGEDPLDCATRELAEETGLRATHWEPLCTLYTSPGLSDERLFGFYASGLAAGETHFDDDEFLGRAALPLSEALSLVRSGAIEDSKTIAGLWALKALIEERA